MVVLANAVVTLTSDTPAAGGWLSVSNGASAPMLRDRVGRQAGSALFGLDSSYQTQRRNRLLTTEQLWLVYQRTPDVRSAVDQITRRIATWDWVVEPTLDPKDDGYQAAQDAAEEARRFLQAPNEDGETWQDLLTKTVTDLLVFDAGVIENVFDSTLVEDDETGEFSMVPGDDLQELVALRGGDIRPIVNQFGRVLGYQQDLLGTGTIVPNKVITEGVGGQQIGEGAAAIHGTTTVNPMFAPRQIVYFRLFPNTSSPEGVPLIETILNEVTTILRQAEHTMLTFDADEIPPGILVLTGLQGAAAESAKADLQKMRGKDHKIRVVTSADPNATGAKWVELRHSPKDVDFVNVVREVRRTIWRVFGVQRVEMGDTENMPRAVGEVQLDVSSSHLVGPILELLEARINARILPLVLERQNNPEVAIAFRFDRDAKLSPEERKALMEYLVGLVKQGLMTRNEGRREIGLAPLGDDGDVATVEAGGGPVPLAAILAEPQPAEDGNRPPGGSGDEGVDDPGAATPDEGEEAPGEVSRLPAQRALADDLPSDWQPRGRFRDVRTLKLLDLWEETAGYTRAVRPLFDRAEREVQASIAARYRPGEMDDERASQLTHDISRALDRLEADWALRTAPHYQAAGRIGRDAAADFTGLPVGEDVDERSQQYGERALRFACDPGGVVSDLRASMAMVVSRLTTRATTKPPPDLGPEATLDEAAAATSGAFASQRHRIDNWAGRLVELANTTLRDGMMEGGAVAGGGAAEWWVQWVYVGDENMCNTCDDLGSRGFMPMSALPTTPGGDTECRANCRCVLVMWTREEVDNGTADLL